MFTKYPKECSDKVMVYPGIETRESPKRGMIQYDPNSAKIISGPGTGVIPFNFLVPISFMGHDYRLEVEEGKHKHQKIYTLQFSSGVVFRAVIEGMASVVEAAFYPVIKMVAHKQEVKCDFCVAYLEGFPRPQEGEVITVTYKAPQSAVRQSITCRVVDGELIAEDVSASYTATTRNRGAYRLVKVY